MKAFIYKTNQYLLERFPTIWNTRLFWMLLTAIGLHIVFFLFGLFTLSNPKLLHERYISSIFFDNGTVFLSTIITVLLLVAWLIYMFKNNAFKNFYPTSKTKLFGQFLSYLLIIFSCSTFYLSYNYGIKTYIAFTYPDEQVNKEIDITNDVAMFLSENVSDYTIDKRRHPKPFDDLYCETSEKLIETSKPHLNFLDEQFQFYSLYTETEPLNKNNRFAAIVESNDSLAKRLVYTKIVDSTRIYFYKDSVVDMTAFVKSAKPSYFNSSFTLFISRNDTLKTDYTNYNYSYDDYGVYDYDYSTRSDFNLRHKLRNKRNYELLKRNDKNEIRQLMDSFLEISDNYIIDHNLTTDKWLELVYHPTNFDVKHYIRTQPKDDYEYVGVTYKDQTQVEKYYVDNRTDFYFDNDALRFTFENIEDVKASNPFMESIHFFMWFSFFLSIIIFMFRISGLKPLLFTIISVGVLTLFITLMTALVFYILRNRGNTDMYFISYLTLFIGSIILVIPLVFIERIKKLIVAICINISLIGFPLYLFLIIGVISMHQDDACRSSIDYTYDYYCPTLLHSLGEHWSYVLFIIAIVFTFFYAKIIKRWKALPEG